MNATNLPIVLIPTVLGLLIGLSESSAAEKRPNILWIVGENFSTDLACYGQQNVATPHLDVLSAAGVRYANAFATSPVCAPSRSCFMLGMYQTTTDTHHMRSHRDDNFRLPAGVRPITHWLRDLGYCTANIKMIGDVHVGTGKLDLNFVNEGPIYDSDDWGALKSRQPFFAVVNSHENEYDIYDRKSASKDRVPWVGEREHIRHADPKDVTPPPYYPDHPIVREEWARYLNSVSGMDARFKPGHDDRRRARRACSTFAGYATTPRRSTRRSPSAGPSRPRPKNRWRACSHSTRSAAPPCRRCRT